MVLHGVQHECEVLHCWHLKETVSPPHFFFLFIYGSCQAAWGVALFAFVPESLAQLLYGFRNITRACLSSFLHIT